MKEYKVGDWVFYKFELHQIEELEDGRIKKVSDGWFNSSSYSLNDRCFPLNMDTKRISGIVSKRYDEIYENGPKNLNCPDINRWLVKKWCEICSHIGDEIYVIRGLDELNDWCDNVLSELKNIKNKNIEGINLFR